MTKSRILRRTAMDKKQWTLLVLMILFTVFSLLFISPAEMGVRPGNHASRLQQTSVTEGNTRRTDFRDETGKITNAANLGYSTSITETSGNTAVERFYNDQGEPVKRYPGYYALLREYDEKGRMIRSTFLGEDGQPCITGYGYATQAREYNAAGQLSAIRYLDLAGNPVRTSLYGFGMISEYDENGNNRITYVNASGEPMKTELGYASIFREFYADGGPWNGKVRRELYFDEKGNPAALSLGQYGVLSEYNEYGQVSVWTCLGPDGKPAATNKGYTTVAYTYHEDSSVETERYFDAEGNPYRMPDGHYGIRKEGGQAVYLNRNGAENFNIRRLLYNRSRIVVPLVLTAVFLSALAGKKTNAVLLAAGIAAILYMTLLFRDSGTSAFSGFLRYYRRFFINSQARADILKNIWLFIPLGAVLYRMRPKPVILLVPVILSILIEGIQWFTGTGVCEPDDVISNSLGGWIGFCMGGLAAGFRQRAESRKQKTSE